MIVLLGHPQSFTNTDEKHLMTEFIQAYISSSVRQNNHLQIVFSHGLPGSYVVFGDVLLLITIPQTTTTNFSGALTAHHTRCTQAFLVTTRCPRRLRTLGDLKSVSPIPTFIQDLDILMPCTLLFQVSFRACLNGLDLLKSKTTLIVDYK